MTNYGYNYNPVISPDGTSIAFTAKLYRDGQLDYDIYVMANDGTGQRNLTDSDLSGFQYRIE